MSDLVLEDAREYVFPIFDVEAEGNGIRLESRRFLGTAFFVSAVGDAMTAAHVIPSPSDIPDGRKLIAVIRQNDRDLPVWVAHVARFPASDLALVKLNLESSPFLPLSDKEVRMGDDVVALGIPEHEVWAGGKEMRVLKGHVTLSHRHLELSFPVPSGMSGCPIFSGTKVVAYATGQVESEAVVDWRRETTVVTPTKEIVTVTELRRVVAYGLATPLSRFRESATPILDGLTLINFLRSHGGSCD